MAAMSPPLHRGRVLVCRGRALVDLLPSPQRAAYSKVPRRLRSLSVPSRSSSRRSISRNYHSSSGSINRNSCSTGPAAASQHGASGTVKVARARGRLALGGAALLVAGAALAREGQLPESVSEWDDKVRTSTMFEQFECKTRRNHVTSCAQHTRMSDVQQRYLVQYLVVPHEDLRVPSTPVRGFHAPHFTEL